VPLRPRDPKPGIVSVAGAKKSPLEALGFSPNSQNVFSAEMEYASMILGTATASVIQIEMARKARESRVSIQAGKETFVDELAKYLYDLKAIQAREEAGESISYLAGATLKSLENFVRYIVDETREVLKEKELKASRTKISLLWTLDHYEMRADRIQMANGIQQRLRDYVTDVEVVSGSKTRGGAETLDPLKHNVTIVCSSEDYDFLKQAKKGLRNVETTVVLATPSLRRD
jgi:6-pyruvoyl-tetrahydropterin synthase